MSLEINLDNLEVGQSVMIETLNEILVGSISYLPPKNRSQIELDDVEDIRSNYLFKNVQLLSLSQILNIKHLHEVIEDQYDCGKNNTSGDSFKSALSQIVDTEAVDSSKTVTESADNNNSSQYDNHIEYVNLDVFDILYIRQQLNGFVVVTQFDDYYHRAIADITTEKIISLIVEPSKYGRHQLTSVIAIATQNTTYIFDMVAIGPRGKELKMCLEANYPKKIVHNSRSIRDHLHHRQGIKLAGVFDIFEAYCAISLNFDPCSLIETVERVIKMPKRYFLEDNTNYEPSSVLYTRRPLSSVLKRYVVKLAIFQLKLYHNLLHDRMLVNFVQHGTLFSASRIENINGVSTDRILSDNGNTSSALNSIENI